MSPKSLTPELTCFLLMNICSTSILLLYSLPIANTLTLEMVRRDSFDFNLFPNNHSDFQKNRIFSQLSHSRARRLAEQLPIIVSKSVNDSSVIIDTIRPPMKQFMDSLFAVSLDIGSRPYHTYLALDTGSDVLWVQCEGCNDCFPIKNGAFNQSASTSYQTIRFDNPLCQPRLQAGINCKFKIRYERGHVEGIRALESLQLRSSQRGKLMTIPNMLLGCADVVKDWTFGERNDGKNNVVSGVFGLALGFTKYGNSFMELTQNLTKMKFSYCLPSWTASKSKQIPLSFGDDVPNLPASARSTPMKNTMYYLNVHDLSVGGHRLNLNPSLFKRRGYGKGGFIIDSGTGVTFLVHSAYDKVRQALATILASQGKHPVEPPHDHSDMFCYKWPLKVKNPPSVTYHMENNADIDVRFGDLFIREKFAGTKKYFACLTFDYVDDGGLNVLGAAHQADYRFVYDLDHETLHFQRDRC